VLVAPRAVERPLAPEPTASLELLLDAAAGAGPAHPDEPPVLAEAEAREDHPGDGEGRNEHEVGDRDEHRYERQPPAGAEAGQGAGRPPARPLHDDPDRGPRRRCPEGGE